MEILTEEGVIELLESYVPQFEYEDFEVDMETNLGDGSKQISISFNSVPYVVMMDLEEEGGEKPYEEHFKAWAEAKGLNYSCLYTGDDSIRFEVSEFI
jgi:hypothetical protein